MDFLEAENIPYRQQSALNQPPQDARVFTTRREGLRCGTYLVRQSVNVLIHSSVIWNLLLLTHYPPT